ncbi:MAG: peptide chain release factor N(5)-glutamine methyltransferase [Deltaproteobacteria bacterium]|jgi:release factor glutamine methyltransferase|nr:peptide chain release factor N(5)-glutamine methyltransferase [Deltaproteobacteria bacterium]
MVERVWETAAILKTTADFLGQKGIDSPRLEAELLLSEVLGLSRVELYVRFDQVLTPEQVTAYRELVRRRLNHEPSAYILGRKEFYKLTFQVSPATLIPRPETEILVGEALRLAQTFPQPRLADLGCGCGAIALALAKNLPQCQVIATDLSPAALEVAKTNAQNLGVADQVEFRQGDLAEPLKGQTLDLICANLPYIPTAEISTLDPTVAQFEPRLALDGGPDGLEPYRRLLPQVREILAPGGYLLLEIDPRALASVQALSAAAGLKCLPPIMDYSRQNRVALAQA